MTPLLRSSVALALLCTVIPATAQRADWQQVQQLHHRQYVIVESTVQGPNLYTRCRLDTVDSATLTCKEDGWGKPRLVYPVAGVQSVYRIGTSGAQIARNVLGISAAALVLIGLAASNGGVFILGFLFEVIYGAAELQSSVATMFGPPPGPFRPNETQTIIYRRAAAPAAASSASTIP